MEQQRFPQNPQGQNFQGQNPQGQTPPPGRGIPQNQPQYPQQMSGRQQVPPAGQGPQGPGGPKGTDGKKPNKNKKFIILGIFAAIGLILGGIVFSQVNKYAKAMTVIDLPGVPVLDSSGKVTTVMPDETGDENSLAGIDLAELTSVKGDPWDGSSRVTCLAMGLDLRDWEAGEEFSRTDSMMLLTYDPITGMAGMLSIPRDLWVAIPNHGYGRINTAYFLGEAERLPGGGPQLAMETVELLLGIDIQYYAVINFDGFVNFIDSIDKLAIHIKEQITVDPIGPGNTVTLYPGVQDLDGATALAYARHRYSEGGDFERAQRQQDVIYALYEQLIWQLPSMLINKTDQLFASVSETLKTNLTFSDIMKLAWTAVDLKPWQIVRSVIAPPYQVDYGRTADGTQQILIPIPDKIREARDVIFSTSIAAGPVTVSEDKAALIAAESARVTILNGSSNGEILDRTVTYLQSFGITVVSTGQGSNSYVNSLEINNGRPFTAQFLKEIMSIPVEATTINYSPGSSSDITVTITDAWVNSNPM